MIPAISSTSREYITVELDKINKNTFWQDAMAKEMNSLRDLEYFEFKD